MGRSAERRDEAGSGNGDERASLVRFMGLEFVWYSVAGELRWRKSCDVELSQRRAQLPISRAMAMMRVELGARGRFTMVGAECAVAGTAMADCEECGDATSEETNNDLVHDDHNPEIISKAQVTYLTQ